MLSDRIFNILKGRICAARRHKNHTGELASALMMNRVALASHTKLDITHKLGVTPTYVVEVNKYFKLYDVLKEKGITIPQDKWS